MACGKMAELTQGYLILESLFLIGFEGFARKVLREFVCRAWCL